MRNIKLEYSVDGGTNWVTVGTLKCLSSWAYIMPTFENSGCSTTTTASTKRKTQIATPRINLDISVSSKNFNVKENASGLTIYPSFQKWCCAPLRRLYNADHATTSIDGVTLWDADPNTNYVNLRADPKYNFQYKGAGGKILVSIEIELETRDAVSL